MFSNRFNTRNDPLLEAAEAAMKDGETRRQAEAVVNEAFGVYSRKAVVREELADYDAALEEVYSELKEGVQIDEISKELAGRYVKKSQHDVRIAMNQGDEKRAKKRMDGIALAQAKIKGPKVHAKEELADKDYDKDGKVESPKDEVWGSRLRAAKMAGKLKEEEQIDEIKMSKIRKLADKGDTKRLLKIGQKEMKKSQKAENKGKYGKMLKHFHKGDVAMNNAEEYHFEAEQIDEAAYSAKAARAGKDIGKPGKQFSKIAKSAGKRYGSEERGKKVAGAILARIRAKHMKEENLEELSAFGKEFAAARAKGQTQFMSKTTGKMTTTALKSPSSAASKPTGSSAIGGVNPGISTRQAAQGTTIKQSGGFSTDAPKPSAGNYPDRGNVATGKSFDAIDKATNAAADKAATARVKAAVAGTDYAKPSKPADSHIGGKTQHWSDQGAKERAGSMTSQAATVSAAGDKPSAMTGTQNVPTPPSRPASVSSTSTPAPSAAAQPGAPKNDASAGVKKLMAMSESVQIGDYKYRII